MMLVMELVGGGNLGKALSLDRAQPRRLGWHRNGRFVLLGIARGLAFIHSRNVRPSFPCRILRAFPPQAIHCSWTRASMAACVSDAMSAQCCQD